MKKIILLLFLLRGSECFAGAPIAAIAASMAIMNANNAASLSMMNRRRNDSESSNSLGDGGGGGAGMSGVVYAGSGGGGSGCIDKTIYVIIDNKGFAWNFNSKHRYEKFIKVHPELFEFKK